MKSVVVTGASTGIGWGCVKVLIGKGFRVFGSVRKQADADRLSKEFGATFMPLLFDVTDAAAVERGAEQVADDAGQRDAGRAGQQCRHRGRGAAALSAFDEFRQQIEVNLTGQLIVTQAFAPLLGADTRAKASRGASS